MAIIVVSITTIYTNATVIMTMNMIMLRNKTMIMTMVVIKKITDYMSMFATRTMTKFSKNKFKKTIFVAFQDDKKGYKSLMFTFPLKIDALSLFCQLNLSV